MRPDTPGTHVSGLEAGVGFARERVMWKVAFLALLWVICKEWNKRF